MTPLAEERLLRAIAALRTRPEFDVLVDWLARCETMARNEVCEAVQDVSLRQAQGRAQFLQTLNTLIATAGK